MSNGLRFLIVLAVALGISACGGSTNSGVTGVTATSGNGSVTLTWSPVSGATSYNVYYSTNYGVAPTSASNTIGTLSQKGLTTTATTITGLTNGTIWYFVVTAVTSTGESSPSGTVSSTPYTTTVGTGSSAYTPVSGVTVVSPGAGQAKVSWGAVSGAISYSVYWDTTPNVSASSPGVVRNITGSTVTVSGLASGVIYYFIVVAETTPPSAAVSVQL